MPASSLVLASASPARLRLLREAGFDPQVIVSGVDEEAVVEADPSTLVRVLAEQKAGAVVDRCSADALVIGCDSMLVFGEQVLGKPRTPAEATERWRAMRGGVGTLLTGHCIVDVGNDQRVSEVASTVVRFGTPSDAEIAAYVATGEPLGVAGAFTLQGRSAPFIDGIDGDAGNVIGLSLPLFRTLLGRLDVEVTSLWV
ncbi:MAG TPA: nucleoside triphosphate pyrophosphatase [Acidimicrobiales bacterium]|nr:nucleoside triphosphate pyrophosphatase [Acidimicrobiales bacterium]